MIVLGVPTMGSIPVKVIGCIDNLIMKREVIPYYTEYSLIYDARRLIMQYALDKGADLLFLDSDICFPLEGFDRLLNHSTDICSGLYWDRHGSGEPIAYKKVLPSTWYRKDPVVERIDTIENYMQVDGVGLGFCLIRYNVLEAFAGDKHNPFEPFGNLGEDFSFLYRCRKKGFKIMLDTSFELKHLGEYAYTIKDARVSACERV